MAATTSGAYEGTSRSRRGENRPVDLGRIAWLATVLISLITAVILVLEGYYGYAGVTFAVALAAGINLF